MKKKLLLLWLAVSCCITSRSANGDDFSVYTKEGALMFFKVINESSKTCQVGGSIGNYATAFGGHNGVKGIVTIPSVANGYTVTAIDKYSFMYCYDLTSLVIPNSVSTIGEDMCTGCSNLTSINIPQSVTTISNYAFVECISLLSIEIPNSVVTIGQTAFYGCKGLTSLAIPGSVTFIGSDAFWGCSGLERINVADENEVYDSRNNCNAIIITETNTLIQGCQNTIIPDDIISISNGAFRNCEGLSSIRIPVRVSAIGKGAFKGCNNLLSVICEIEDPLEIDSTAFSNRANATLYVPIGSKAAYEAADYWKEFKEIVEIEDDSDTDISQMENVIYTEPTSGLAGTTIGLCVKMKNMLTPVGCSFKLTLPEGLRLQTDADGDVVYELGSRAKKMSLTMQDWGDGSYDFALTPSTATATITGNDDTFITFHVVLPDDMVAGDYKLKLSRCLIQSKTDGTTKDYILSDVVSTLTVEDYMMGDVNGDRTITPSDAIMTLYHYFSVEQTGFNAKAADVNGDGTVTPADAIEMLYMYFGAGSNAARQNKQTHEPQ